MNLSCSLFLSLSLSLSIHLIPLLCSLVSLCEGLAQRTNKGQAAPTAQDDWNVLRSGFGGELGQLHCASDEYEDYFKSLPTFELARMKIPPNTRVLFYGTSFLHQILSNILLANFDVLIKNGPFGGDEGDKLDTSNNVFGTGYWTQWSFEVNSTIVEVQNYAPLQHVDNIDKLDQFMREFHFDVAFFMNPHPDCALNWKCTSEHGRAIRECSLKYKELVHDALSFCANQIEGDYIGERSDVNPFWDAIHQATQGNVYEVEAWTKQERQWFHADESHTIHTYPVLSGFACNVGDNCTSSAELEGHQCQPGRLALVAELVVANMEKRW